MKWYVTAFAILLSYQEVVASDDDFRCDKDAETQRSELEIKQHFEAKGWEIRRIKREHGCFGSGIGLTRCHGFDHLDISQAAEIYLSFFEKREGVGER